MWRHIIIYGCCACTPATLRIVATRTGTISSCYFNTQCRAGIFSTLTQSHRRLPATYVQRLRNMAQSLSQLVRSSIRESHKTDSCVDRLCLEQEPPMQALSVRCKRCVKSFASKNELDMVSRFVSEQSQQSVKLEQHAVVHKPRNMECWACYSKHRTISDIFLHLESGACDGDWDAETISEELRKLDGPWRNHEDRDESTDEGPIKCPKCCRVYGRVSAFLQHVGSPSCEEGFSSGRCSAIGLLRQMRRNMGAGKQVISGITI